MLSGFTHIDAKTQTRTVVARLAAASSVTSLLSISTLNKEQHKKIPSSSQLTYLECPYLYKTRAYLILDITFLT